MPKFKRLSQAPIGKDWMKYRPYSRFSQYDNHYLKLAKAVYAYLIKPAQGFQQAFQREDLKEMAILVTSHVEDFVSEIGLWKALVDKQKELHGWYIPFYDLKNYDPDYLNWQDFAYLLWHHLGKLSNKTLNPFSEALLKAAEFLYDFFDRRIEQIPATDFYDDWLNFSDDIYFFDLKTRINWMAFENYITGLEHNDSLAEDIKELFEKNPEMVKQAGSKGLIYGMEDDYRLLKRSSWCGLSTPEWLAEVARCLDTLRDDIRQLSRRVQGIFLFESLDDQHYHFTFVSSNRGFSILRESVELDASRLKPGHTLANFSIVPWQDDWWLSGVYMEWGEAKDKLDALRYDPKHSSFYGYTDKKQEEIRELAQEMEEAFISYFEKRLVFFPDEKTMAQAMQDQSAWWNEQKAKKIAPVKQNPKHLKHFEEKPSLLDTIDLGEGATAAFYVPGEAVMMSTLIPELVDLMQKKSLSERDSKSLFYTFFNELEPSIAHYIASHYPTDKLCFPLVSDPGFVEKHFDFFLRYYNPNSFSEAIPKISMIPE